MYDILHLKGYILQTLMNAWMVPALVLQLPFVQIVLVAMSAAAQ